MKKWRLIFLLLLNIILILSGICSIGASVTMIEIFAERENAGLETESVIYNYHNDLLYFGLTFIIAGALNLFLIFWKPKP
jgi:hypothetical protein